MTDCCSPCSPAQLPPVQIPGPSVTGPAGADGTNGVSAFSLTTAPINVADLINPISIPVSSSLWMVVGATIVVGQGAGAALANAGPGTFKITGVTSPTNITALWLKGSNDPAAPFSISAGAVVAPSGFPAIPVPIANGGTAATTKATAQTSLGLGQDAITSNNTGLTQAMTNAIVQIGTIDVQYPASGTPWAWLIRGWVSIDWSGVSAASRTVTFQIKNITSGAILASKVIHTQAMTTLTFPTTDFVLQVEDTAGNINEHLQLMIGSDGPNPPNTAGTWQIIAANLMAIPLRKS